MDDGTREIRPGRAATTQPYEEEFLFHLSRGSEYLVENHVERAKEELERALGYQPHDAKGQDLLASVYFRLGVYPRAIEIWSRLAKAHPGDLALRVNLGLVLLKTGQPEEARANFQRATEIDPRHARAYRYLGLAQWRCGDLDRARESFLRGGEVTMARRMEEMLDDTGAPAAGPPAWSEPTPAAGDALAPQGIGSDGSDAHGNDGASHATAETPGAPAALRVEESGLLRVRASGPVCFRAERVRARRAGVTTDPVTRRDGTASPFVRTRDGADVLVAAPEGLRFVAMTRQAEVLFVVEAHLEAFEGTLAFETARAFPDLDVVSLRGAGGVVLRLRAEPSTLEVPVGQAAEVDARALVGWTGRLLPEGTLASGMLAFRGEGALLVL